jgi:hypothetical protein
MSGHIRIGGRRHEGAGSSVRLSGHFRADLDSSEGILSCPLATGCRFAPAMGDRLWYRRHVERREARHQGPGGRRDGRDHQP